MRVCFDWPLHGCQADRQGLFTGAGCDFIIPTVLLLTSTTVTVHCLCCHADGILSGSWVYKWGCSDTLSEQACHAILSPVLTLVLTLTHCLILFLSRSLYHFLTWSFSFTLKVYLFTSASHCSLHLDYFPSHYTH